MTVSRGGETWLEFRREAGRPETCAGPLGAHYRAYCLGLASNLDLQPVEQK